MIRSESRRRYEAFWQGQMLDRPLLQVTAPREPQPPEPDPAPADERDLRDWFTNPARVLPRLERQVASIAYEGDAFPLVFPLSTSLPAIEAAYLGTPYRVVPGANTGWSSPLVADWEHTPPLAVDEDNGWWRATQRLLAAGAEASRGRYAIGIPDLQGGGQIVAELRGSERLALDLVDHPQAVKRAIRAVNEAWWHYYQACTAIICRHQKGYVDWLGVWSDRPAVTVECDFSCLISPAMFAEFFLPALVEQTEWVGRTIYHLDGPGAIRHLDSLLALPALTGIQWVPGAGQAPMREWIPLLQRIQGAGKRLVVACEPEEVRPLLTALRPEGIILSTTCPTVAAAEALVVAVTDLFR